MNEPTFSKSSIPSARLQLIFLVILIIGTIAAYYPLMHLTGRDQFPETGDPDSKPLNMRLGGYTVEAATDYWTWLQRNDGIVAERWFLVLDLLFPLLYCGAVFMALQLVWTLLNRPFHRNLLFVPVALTAMADWAENLVHLRQLGHIIRNESLNSGCIQLASVATVTKWGFLVISLLFLVALIICLIFRQKNMPT